MAKHKRLFIAIALFTIGILPFGLAGLAGAQAVVRSYTTDTPLEPGMIVQLDPKDSSKVLPATATAADKIHGVVVSPNDAPVSLQTSTNTRQAYVATTGEYQVLVSDQGGSIQRDDYITLSSLAGVGMKAGASQTVVLGKALNGFDGKTNVKGTTTLKENGRNVTVHLGYVGIDISLSHNPLYRNSTKSEIQDALQRIAQSVAHKPVSLAHIYMSIAILFASVVISGVLMYTGVRGSLLAMGRNPLARSHILRSMIQVILTSIVILVIGIFAVYLLLKV
jgi:hypothetical protein